MHCRTILNDARARVVKDLNAVVLDRSTVDMILDAGHFVRVEGNGAAHDTNYAISEAELETIMDLPNEMRENAQEL